MAQTDKLQHFDELLTEHEPLISVSNRRRTAQQIKDRPIIKGVVEISSSIILFVQMTMNTIAYARM